MNQYLEHKEKGFYHLKNVIPDYVVLDLRERLVNLKLKYAEREGEPRHNGTGMFWKGLELASTLDPNLWQYYKSEFMLDIAQRFLDTDIPYLFNDQAVVKLPDEEFFFPPHTDNKFGPDPEGALRGEFSTINCCMILVDSPKEAGGISCFNKVTQEYEFIDTKAGDIIVIDGNTLHKSEVNNITDPRPLYACVYSTHPIGNHDKGYYNEKFI